MVNWYFLSFVLVFQFSKHYLLVSNINFVINIPRYNYITEYFDSFRSKLPLIIPSFATEFQ